MAENKVFGPASVKQRMMLEAQEDIILVGGGAGGGKALRHGEKVLTVNGFVNIEDIKVGDKVITPDNTVETVTGVFPQGVVDLYRVRFQDGRIIDCCGEHLWKWHEAGDGQVNSKITNTLEMLKVTSKYEGTKGIRKRLPIIPLIKPVQHSEHKEHVISPYAMGVILGDGHIPKTGSPAVTNSSEFVWEELKREGITPGAFTLNEGRPTSVTKTLLGTFSEMERLGLRGTLSQTKFIPEEYMLGSIKNRFDLLQGLFDTDGYVCKRGNVYYDTTSERMAHQVKEILHSLGYTAKLSTKQGSYVKDGVKHICSIVYKLYVRGMNQGSLFRLPAKKDRTISKHVGLRVECIEPIGKGEASCISISGDEKLYITTNYIVTHNTSTILMKMLAYLDDPNERIVIARKSRPELTRPGGIVNESKQFYQPFGGDFNKTGLIWTFPSQAEIQFLGIPDASVLGSLQGLQASRLCVDEAGDDWSLDVILFLLSRVRSAHSKYKEQVILTANPNHNSFLREWVDYCLDEDGVPKPGTEDKVRWMVVLDGKVLWADSEEECFEIHGAPRGMIRGKGLTAAQIRDVPKGKLFIAKSFRFIPSTVYDNPYLLPPRNNTYLPSLLAQPKRNQLKYLHGSWLNIDVGQNMFNRSWCDLITMDQVPVDTDLVRAYDLAATEKSEVNRNPDATVGMLMGRDRFGTYYVIDMVKFHAKPHAVLERIITQATRDGLHVPIVVPQDAGAAGKYVANHMVTVLSEEGLIVKVDKMSGWSGKLQRFLPFCQLAEAGKVKIVVGAWNDEWLETLEMFKGTPESMRKIHDDEVDATSSALKILAKAYQSSPNVSLSGISLTREGPIPS
jgi:predicted phage terminase large subunit-like protein